MQEQVRLPEFLARFNFVKNPPSPMKSWPELGTLNFDYPKIAPPPHPIGTLSFDYPRIPPSNEKLQLECVETNRCIPQGYRLVVLLWCCGRYSDIQVKMHCSICG